MSNNPKYPKFCPHCDCLEASVDDRRAVPNFEYLGETDVTFCLKCGNYYLSGYNLRQLRENGVDNISEIVLELENE